MIVMRAVDHCKELWADDAANFEPERWLESSNGGAESNFSFVTFLHCTSLRSMQTIRHVLMLRRAPFLHRAGSCSCRVCMSSSCTGWLFWDGTRRQGQAGRDGDRPDKSTQGRTERAVEAPVWMVG